MLRRHLMGLLLIGLMGCQRFSNADKKDAQPDGIASVPIAKGPASPFGATVDASDGAKINYFLAVQAWNTTSLEKKVGESGGTPAQIFALARATLAEVRQAAQDSDGLPQDFRIAFNRALQAENERYAFAERTSTPTNLLALGADYVFRSGNLAKATRDEADRIAAEIKQATTSLEAIALKHGARTDFQALPRVVDVQLGGIAAKIGVKKSDFLLSYNGATLYRKSPVPLIEQAKTQGAADAEVRFLTPSGMIKARIPTHENLGATFDPTSYEPPISVILEPYLIQSGYYIHVINSSANANLESIVVRLRNAQGQTSRELPVGRVNIQASTRVDPDSIGWRLAPGDTIIIEAEGFSAPRTFDSRRLLAK